MLDTTRKNGNVTLVCTIAKFECGRLIQEARRIADMTNTRLYVVNVQRKCEWGNKLCKELEYLFMISKNSDAQMLTFFSDDPISILNDCMKRSNVKHIVLEDRGIETTNFLEQLDVKSKEMEVHICKY